jgi:RNA polymerase sigma-70 factor (ECF subfamily)
LKLIHTGKGLAMNQNEFAVKISELRDSLYRMAFIYLGGETPALKAVDEAVFKALLALPRLRRPDCFCPWVYRILINQCRQEQKLQGQTTPSHKLSLSLPTELSAQPLPEAISRLPRKLKEPVILYYFGNLDTAKIAYALKISKAAAETRLQRGVSLLGLDLSQEEKVI